MRSKLFRLFMVLLLVVGVLFTNNFKVSADGDDTMELIFPTNEVDVFGFYSNYDVRHAAACDTIINFYSGDGTIVNGDGKSIFSVGGKNDNVFFELLDGVSEDDCVLPITDQMRSFSINQFGTDLFEGFSNVKVSLAELSRREIGSTLTIDFVDKNSAFDMNFIDYYILSGGVSFFSDYLNVVNHTYLYDITGKVIFELVKTNGGATQYVIPDGINGSDDLIYIIQDSERDSFRRFFGGDVNRDRIVLSFGDNNYSADDYLVLDFKAITSDTQWKYTDMWDVLFRKDLTGGKSVSTDLLDDDKYLLTIINIGESMFDLEYADGISYNDNIIIDLDEESNLKQALNQQLGLDLSKIILKFKNPEFIEGNNQEFDNSSEESLSFRLNIEFDKFLESGVVYLDDEVVDPENYEATEGSTIITFKDGFLNGLDAGDHEVKVVVSDGYATANFKYVDNSSAEDDDPIIDGGDAEPETDKDNGFPETGDNLYFLLFLMISSVCGLYVTKKKLA